ncbi:MAG: hypothetical protein K2X82_12530 [Gemmataceae bacterium]|nr:hypothetical protein [Gemmataceae bacterium]
MDANTPRSQDEPTEFNVIREAYTPAGPRAVRIPTVWFDRAVDPVTAARLREALRAAQADTGVAADTTDDAAPFVVEDRPGSS